MWRSRNTVSGLLILVVFLVIGCRFESRGSTLAGRGAFRSLAHFGDLVYVMLEGSVVFAKLSKFSIE